MANSKVSQDTGDLKLDRISKHYGDFCAVDDLSLVVPDGSFFALLGPSGCGKTTTLRMIAGLEEPSAGTISIGETDITTQKSYRRNVNTVFQNYALFPHLTIFENIAFGLRRRGIKDVKTEVENALNLVEMGHLSERKPNQLSGGQQQRVFLARALAQGAELYIMDEPFVGVDVATGKAILELLSSMRNEGKTVVIVHHDLQTVSNSFEEIP